MFSNQIMALQGRNYRVLNVFLILNAGIPTPNNMVVYDFKW